MQGKVDQAQKMSRNLNQTERDNLTISNITEQEWLRYYERLWTKEQLRETEFPDINKCEDPIAIVEFLSALQWRKNKNLLAIDGINLGLIKYVPSLLNDHLLNFYSLCWTTGHITEDRQMGKVVPIFKKGDRNDSDNYGWVNLLNTSYKIACVCPGKTLNGLTEAHGGPV